ncbi:glycerol kinase GlpK [Erysipelothrix sp. HDW6C]|uniref:glycerol kinase GlpK n=1 Tax=Erysipelothrix sp. HDW6C TaxID=2714930 RepID=UPI00140D7B41|nr:glycerol kinase GlpK [Erysipelothrix sp. HDW6C]QIK70732.1 glycerol kinase GlpK [Erysipelothrix sp. HDW6C]
MGKYIIALDQGTTSSRAIIFDKDHNMVDVAQADLQQFYPQSGWVEQDPMDIWSTQSGVLNQVIAKSGIDVSDIDSIGITNQRETTIIWDRVTGRPIYNAIVWQCRRTAHIAAQLVEDGHAEYIRNNTGLVVDAYFSATKIRWILDKVPGAQQRAERGELMFGTVDAWLIYNLTDRKVHVTDVTNASRTMLFNIHTLEWDQSLLEILNIPQAILPSVISSSEVYGYTNIQGHQVKLAGVAGDQQAALFGQTAFNPGEAKNTYGTGCFVLMNTGTTPVLSQHGLVTTIASSVNGEIHYALEGSIFAAGSIMRWLRDDLNMIATVQESETLANQVKDTQGAVFVPAFSGLGAPYWDMYARGAIHGMSYATGRNHIVRAALESIAYQSHDVLKAMEQDSGYRLTNLQVDGGASSNQFLMQFQADILGIDVNRPTIRESTALGAAFLAGLATGFFTDKKALKSLHSQNTTWTPKMDETTRQTLIKQWQKAVGRSTNWLE